MSETTENRLFLGGWICVWRKIANSTLWLDEKFTKGQAWIDLLLLAQGVYATELRDGQYREFYPGVVYWSVSSLAERWKWSRRTATRFLKELEKAGMLSIKSKPKKGTILKVENWAQYQDPKSWKKHQNECAQTLSQKNGSFDGNLSQTLSHRLPELESQTAQGIEGDFQGDDAHQFAHVSAQMSAQIDAQMSAHNINQNNNQTVNQSKRKGDDFPSENGKEKIPAMWRDKFESYEDYWRWRNQ